MLPSKKFYYVSNRFLPNWKETLPVVQPSLVKNGFGNLAEKPDHVWQNDGHSKDSPLRPNQIQFGKIFLKYFLTTGSTVIDPEASLAPAPDFAPTALLAVVFGAAPALSPVPIL